MRIKSRRSREGHPVDSHILYRYICEHIRCQEERKGARERKRRGKKEGGRDPGRIVPVDFTVVINRHRLLIVLDLDGGAVGAIGPCISGSTKGPRAPDSLACEGCTTYRAFSELRPILTAYAVFLVFLFPRQELSLTIEYSRIPANPKDRSVGKIIESRNIHFSLLETRL